MATLFPILTATRSKALRLLLFQKIVSVLRAVNARAQNQRLNRSFQTLLFEHVAAAATTNDGGGSSSSSSSGSGGIWAAKFTRELWRRRVWTDARAVEIMKEACLSDSAKVATAGVRFFLGVDQAGAEGGGDGEDGDDDGSDDEAAAAADVAKLKHQMGVNKKTRKKAKELEKALATVKKVQFGRKKKNKRAPILEIFPTLLSAEGRKYGVAFLCWREKD